MTIGTSTDWRRWLQRWEAQQSGHVAHREERFAVIVDVVEAVGGASPHVVDLGCGPGSLARRILERIPGSRVTAIDMDPVLLRIGREALGDLGGRLRWLDADLRSDWTGGLGPVDAAVSTTALHWLQPAALAALYARLGTVIRPGGVVVNGDRMDLAADEPTLAGALAAMRERRDAPLDPQDGAETWDEWWRAAEAEPALADAVAERGRRHHDHPDHDHPQRLDAHVGALRDAGFREVDTVWQNLLDRVLVAVR